MAYSIGGTGNGIDAEALRAAFAELVEALDGAALRDPDTGTPGGSLFDGYATSGEGADGAFIVTAAEVRAANAPLSEADDDEAEPLPAPGDVPPDAPDTLGG